MHCTQCGSLNGSDARFCGECGGKLDSSEGTEQYALYQQAATVQPDASSTETGNFKGNEYVKQGKVISKQFFGFALEALKGPMAASRKTTQGDKINGIIAHILFALLLPLFSYLTAKSVSSGLIEVPFGAVVIQPFFILLIYLALYTAVIFGVAKLMKASVNFTEVMTRFGVFNVLPAAFLFLAVLFSMLSAGIFSFILFGIALSLFVVSSVSVVFSIKEDSTKGLDVFYGLIIANVAMCIIFIIIGDSIIGNLMDQLDSMLYGFL